MFVGFMACSNSSTVLQFARVLQSLDSKALCVCFRLGFQCDSLFFFFWNTFLYCDWETVLSLSHFDVVILSTSRRHRGTLGLFKQ